MRDSAGRLVAARYRLKKPLRRVGERVTCWPYSWEADRRQGLYTDLGDLPRPPGGHGVVVRLFPKQYLCYEVLLDGGERVLYARGDLGLEVQ